MPDYRNKFLCLIPLCSEAVRKASFALMRILRDAGSRSLDGSNPMEEAAIYPVKDRRRWMQLLKDFPIDDWSLVEHFDHHHAQGVLLMSDDGPDGSALALFVQIVLQFVRDDSTEVCFSSFCIPSRVTLRDQCCAQHFRITSHGIRMEEIDGSKSLWVVPHKNLASGLYLARLHMRTTITASYNQDDASWRAVTILPNGPESDPLAPPVLVRPLECLL